MVPKILLSSSFYSVSALLSRIFDTQLEKEKKKKKEEEKTKREMSDNVIELLSKLPEGFRFSPTDEEVILYYLGPKIAGMVSEVDSVISEVDFYQWEPWELAKQSKNVSRDNVRWFFSSLDFKYPKSKRANRKTKTGFWKITGPESEIKGRDGFSGRKRILVFRTNSDPENRTGWVMHEYYPKPDDAHALPSQKAYVVCRLEFKPDEKGQKAGLPGYDRGERRREIMPDLENPVPSVAIPVGHGHNEDNLQAFLQPIHSPDYRYLNEMQASVGTYEFEDLLTQILVNSPADDTEENNCGASLRASAKRSYFVEGPVGSDTDNEGVNEQYIQTLESSSSFGLPGGTKKIRHRQMVKVTPSETVHTSTGDNSKQEIIVPLYDQFTDEDAFSDDLTAYGEEINRLNLATEEDAGEINCFDSVTEEGPYVFVKGGGRQKRIQPQKKASSAAISGNKARGAAKHTTANVDEPLKEKSTAKSPNAGKKAQCSNLEKHLNSAGYESTVRNKRNYFTFVETSSGLSCNSTPSSVYLFNAIVGASLFVVFVRELVLLGSWC